MIDIKLLRDEPEKVRVGVEKKGSATGIVDKALELDKAKRNLIGEVEALRAQRNKITEQIKTKEANAQSLIPQASALKQEIKTKEFSLQNTEEEFNNVFSQIPNMPFESVPVGKGEAENIEVRKWGTPRDFSFPIKDHLELGSSLKILDFETGAKVTGSQFYYLYGDGARLELALVQYAFDKLSKEGFLPVITPDMAKARYYLGTGYMPKGDEAQTYTIEGEDLGLIATAEVTLAGKHADEIISEDALPIKYIGYSHCFRKEAGAYGKYSKGLYRVHQFTKAEMFIYCRPEESELMHQLILENEEKIYQELGIPYRVVEMCSGDLGAMAARKYDLEAWMPGRNDYGEITSTSNCTDYQARNLNIKFRKKAGTTEYIHMLNGTAIVTSRVPLAILENFQEADGSVVIPEVLRPFMGGKEKITAPEQ